MWCPIRLSHSRSDLSHLFFVNDFIIFSKANVQQAKLLKAILENFFCFSGHKINAGKTNIFFSSAVRENLGRIISGMLGFKKVEDLSYNFGVPLFHERATNNTLRFVVEKVRNKLQSWEARQLSLAGKLTLAQAVLLSIPTYFMQSMMIFKGIS